jgi:hypothetical protein
VYATSVWGLKLLVYGALSCWCMGPQATSFKAEQESDGRSDPDSFVRAKQPGGGGGVGGGGGGEVSLISTSVGSIQSMAASEPLVQRRQARMLAYAGVFCRMLTYAHVCSRMLTHADVCARMRTYAHVCKPYCSLDRVLIQSLNSA